MVASYRVVFRVGGAFWGNGMIWSGSEAIEWVEESDESGKEWMDLYIHLYIHIKKDVCFHVNMDVHMKIEGSRHLYLYMKIIRKQWKNEICSGES